LNLRPPEADGLTTQPARLKAIEQAILTPLNLPIQMELNHGIPPCEHSLIAEYEIT